MRTLRISGGTEIKDALRKAYLLSEAQNDTVSFVFNDIEYIADAAHKTFSTASTHPVALDRVEYGTKLIPTFNDPVLASLRKQLAAQQDVVRSLREQITDRVEKLTGKA